MALKRRVCFDRRLLCFEGNSICVIGRGKRYERLGVFENILNVRHSETERM